MPRAIAHVRTPRANGYLQQLCKHWSHRFDVTLTPAAGRIDFGGGESLVLTAEGDLLSLTAGVAAGGDLVALQNVVTAHLLRFAFRDPPAVVWQPLEPTDPEEG